MDNDSARVPPVRGAVSATEAHPTPSKPRSAFGLVADMAGLNPRAAKVLAPALMLLAGLAAGLALFEDWQTALFGGLLAIAAAAVLLAVTRASTADDALARAGVAFTHFCVLAACAALALLLASVAADWPKPLACLVHPLNACTVPARPPFAVGGPSGGGPGEPGAVSPPQDGSR